MSTRWWIGLGWLIICVSAGFAIASTILAWGAVTTTCSQAPGVRMGMFTCPGTATHLMVGIICGVLSGVAFFTGLACFFWSALRQRY
jgi:hypothetical protein